MQLDLFLHAKIITTPEPVVRLDDGSTVNYTLRRSHRAKNVWLRIGIGTGLEVVVPAGIAPGNWAGSLGKQAWIQSQMVRIGSSWNSARQVLRTAQCFSYGEERCLRIIKTVGSLPL
jgi:hypothetical protein